jgi:hypothetical protein
MNHTALLACFSSISFAARLHGALVKTAKLGHSVAHVTGRKGGDVLAVKYSRSSGFSFFDTKGKDHTETVLTMMKMGV